MIGYQSLSMGERLSEQTHFLHNEFIFIIKLFLNVIAFSELSISTNS